MFVLSINLEICASLKLHFNIIWLPYSFNKKSEHILIVEWMSKLRTIPDIWLAGNCPYMSVSEVKSWFLSISMTHKWTGIRMPLLPTQWFQHSRIIWFTNPFGWSILLMEDDPTQSTSCPMYPVLPAAIILLGRTVFSKAFSAHYSCCLCRVSNVSASKVLSPSISYSHNHKE